MIINHNMGAANAIRQMGVNQSNANKSMEKLSSGLRINSASDDAAGLAISEKMRGQIRGLDQASANAQDAISLTQTAEGALSETQSILQRMRELAVQSSNDTNVDTDRQAIQDEMDQLTKEISRIGETTEFNTQSLLTGGFDGTFHIGANEGQNLNLKISDMRANSLGVTGSAKIEVVATAAKNGGGAAANITGTKADGTYTIEDTNLKDKNGIIVATTADGGKVWTGNGNGAIGDDTIKFTQAVDSGSIEISNNVVSGKAEFDTKLEAGDYTIDYANGASTLKNSAGEVIATSDDDKTFKSAKDGTTELLVLDAAVTADSSVSVGGIDVSSQTSANKAVTTINNALENVSSERSKLGAIQNRLEHTINNLGTSSENLTSAESRIRDVDMAKEMSEFSKNNILSQAAQAMLAQANQQPQQVLQLLR